MSTILKALRRLEQEKSAQANRPLSEAVAAAAAAPRPPRRFARWLVAAAALVVALGIGAVAFRFVRSGDEAESADPVEVAALTQQGSKAPAEAAPQRKALRPRRAAKARRDHPTEDPRSVARAAPRTKPADPSGLSPAALSSKVEVMQRVRPATPPGAATASEPAASATGAEVATTAPPPETQRFDGGPAPEPAPRTAPARATEERVQLAAAAPPVKPPPAPREEPEPEPEPEPRAAKPEPILRTPMPSVYVESTIWHPDASRRLAVVELAGQEEKLELREGDAVGPLVVGKIEPSGVFFYHEGIELRRRVGAR